jgi:hypothetical protein
VKLTIHLCLVAKTKVHGALIVTPSIQIKISNLKKSNIKQTDIKKYEYEQYPSSDRGENRVEQDFIAITLCESLLNVYKCTGCDRIRYTTLKIYCDQTNSNITTQFLTEHLLTLQICLQVFRFSMAASGYAADIHTIF